MRLGRPAAARKGTQFFEKCGKLLIIGELDLALQPLKDMRAPFGKILDAACKSVRVKAQPQYIDGRDKKLIGYPRQKKRQRGIARNEIPIAINRNGRKRLVACKHQIHRAARGEGIGAWIIDARLGIDRRKACCEQQLVALSEGHVEPFRQMQQHFAARARAPRFKKAQMPRRDFCIAGKGKLAEAAALAPCPKHLADRTCVLCLNAHGKTLAPGGKRRNYLPRNRRTPAPSPIIRDSAALLMRHGNIEETWKERDMALAAIASSVSVRHAVLADGVISGAMGALLIVAASPLSGLLGISAGFLFWVGVALMPWMLALLLIGRKDQPGARAVETVIALNALWVVTSIGLILFGPFEMTALGIAFVVAQALAVAVFAELQFFGLKRAG